MEAMVPVTLLTAGPAPVSRGENVSGEHTIHQEFSVHLPGLALVLLLDLVLGVFPCVVL